VALDFARVIGIQSRFGSLRLPSPFRLSIWICSPAPTHATCTPVIAGVTRLHLHLQLASLCKSRRQIVLFDLQSRFTMSHTPIRTSFKSLPSARPCFVKIIYFAYPFKRPLEFRRSNRSAKLSNHRSLPRVVLL
jgi:hypothetical protein